MARQQTLAQSSKSVAAAATPEQLTGTSTLVCSVLIQAQETNTDFVYIGDSSGQKHALSPGKSVEVHGDNLDIGTSAYIDLSTIYVRVAVNGEGVNYTILRGF